MAVITCNHQPHLVANRIGLMRLALGYTGRKRLMQACRLCPCYGAPLGQYLTVQGKVINLKHAQFLSPESMKLTMGKVEAAGNEKIILTERGYAFGYNDLVVDPRSFYLGYPVMFDVIHSVRKYGIPSANPKGGNREFLPTLARAGVAAGVDVFIETHPEPEKALCDAASQLYVYDFEEFMKPILELHAVEVKYR